MASGKTLYSFGDSLITGHQLHYGMLNDLAEKYQWHWINRAKEGATILTTTPQDHNWASDNNIPDVAAQIQEAPAAAPDVIIFDGLVNDCIYYLQPKRRAIGQCSDSFADEAFDQQTFAGAFEHVCWLLRRRYPDTAILYAAVHHLPAIPLALQDQVHSLTAGICRKWALPIADVYGQGQINTFLPAMAQKYTYDQAGQPFGGDGTHLTPAGYQRFYTPLLTAALRRLGIIF